MHSSHRELLNKCSEIMSKVEIDLIEWRLQLRDWKETIDGEVPEARRS